MAEFYATTDAADAAPRSTFVAPVLAAHEELIKLSDRLEMLTDRLVGSEKLASGSANHQGPVPVPNGIFADLTERGLDMGQRLDRMSRIERVLP